MNEQLPDLYAVLQVDRTASREEIRRAYRRLLRSFHPDLQSSRGEDEPAHAARSLREVMEAYAVLGDPERRAEYDRATAPAPLRPASREPFLLNWPPRDTGGSAWMFPSRHSAWPDLQELLEYFLRRRFPW
ncbi:J domain-containing protein [Arthrobacter sp. GCM10027362]|uniref:J domain-containing protein n=1 Tax=Arthrobacter sp. GCM10027362 TaxID=3273379 RepID=UPI003632A2AE